jgi:hypothetical protein
MPCHAMHPIQDLFLQVFHMYCKLICILYALLCGQNFILVKSGCYTRRQSCQGERRAGFTVLPSSRPTLTGELLSSGAVRDQAPASVPPRSSGLQSTPPGGPWWTEPPAIHEPWTESTIISYCKIIPKLENPHHLANNPLPLFIINPQSTHSQEAPRIFKNNSKYTPSHFQKLQISPYNFLSPYLRNRSSDFGDSCAKILRITSPFIICIHLTRVCCILLIDCLCLLHIR